MKILVVFYSRTGVTRKIGEKISRNLNADIEEITSFKNYLGIFGAIKASIEAIFKKMPSISKTEKNPFEYDLVIIGTPVWAHTMSSPVRTYLTKNKFKKVAFFCTYQGTYGKVFQKMKQLSKKPINTLVLKTKEIKNNLYKNKIKDFCRV